MFATQEPALFFALVPISTFVSSAWSGAAIATINDLVLPRMRATAGATFLLGMTLVGLALGPYTVGKIGTATGSLRTGIFSLYVVTPFILFILWRASRRIVALEETRDARAEGIQPHSANAERRP
jgi:fucose permease